MYEKKNAFLQTKIPDYWVDWIF